MTVHHLPMPCWVISPRLPREDTDPHYDTRGDALKAIREAWDEDHWKPVPLRAWWREVQWWVSRLRLDAPRPRRIPVRCWIVQDDGGCEQVLDEEDEGYIVHHASRQEAVKTAAEYGWTHSADGRFVYCPCEPREDSEPIPPTPAELEAAGQLRLPGVLP